MRHRIRSSAAILVAALGAGSCISVVFQPQWGGDDSECSELVPFRDDWRIELETSFPLGEITTLQIGRREYMENFANRGDIEVLYDRDDERIAVELRRFTVAQCTEQALEQFSKMHLWAYATAAPPRPFADMPGGAASATTCIPLVATEDGAVYPDASVEPPPWRDGCRVHMYYDGKVEPVRAGADLRVHLPRSYRGRLEVITDDMDFESDYPLRGDVTIDGLCGGGSLQLGSGVAQVKLCDDLAISSTCTEDQIAACDGYTVDGAPAPWHPDCGCDAFDQLTVVTHDAAAADITVDVPGDRWITAALENEASGQVVGEEGACPVTVEGCDEGCALEQDASAPWAARVVLNQPSAAAGEGGYGVDARSSRCALVSAVDGPSDFEDGVEPAPARRGAIKLCSGCL